MTKFKATIVFEFMVDELWSGPDCTPENVLRYAQYKFEDSSWFFLESLYMGSYIIKESATFELLEDARKVKDNEI